MAGELSSNVPVDSTSPFHYRIDHPDPLAGSAVDHRAMVRDALDACRDLLLSERGEAAENSLAKSVLALYASFEIQRAGPFSTGSSIAFQSIPPLFSARQTPIVAILQRRRCGRCGKRVSRRGAPCSCA